MVEFDAYNKDGTLAPGMYPSVDWPVSSAEPLLLSAIDECRLHNGTYLCNHFSRRTCSLGRRPQGRGIW